MSKRSSFSQFPIDIRRRRDTCPRVNVDSLMTTINFVEIAIVNTVRSDGTMFSSRTNYLENAMLRPLRSINVTMESFMAHVERWANKAKLLEHLEPSIKHIYRNKDISDDKRFRKIRRTISQISVIDDSYCSSFDPLIQELKSIGAVLDQLAYFLTSICSERNVPPVGAPNKHARASSSDTTAFDGDSPNPFRAHFRPICIDSSIPTPSSTSLSRSNSLPLLPPVQISRPPPIPWTLMLSDRYPVESLSVSAAELEAFSIVRSAARMAREAVTQAQKLCEKREVLSNDMMQVYELWDEKCLDWESSQDANNGSVDHAGYR